LNNSGIPFTYTFGGSGIPSASANTSPLKIFQQTTCISASLSVQTAPSSSGFVVRLQKSTSATGSFNTVFSASLSSGSNEITFNITNTPELNKNEVIRASIQTNDVASDWIFQVYTERRNV
jgi:hypothetical protein